LARLAIQVLLDFFDAELNAAAPSIIPDWLTVTFQHLEKLSDSITRHTLRCLTMIFE
jgi:hypothetical protein